MKLYNLIFTLIITSSSAYATGVTIPNAFSSGTTTSAAEMNANFDAVKAAVDDNDSRVTILEGSTNASASQFMGFSSGTTDGGGGLIPMGDLCHASFSGSHMCSSVEFAGSKTYGATGLNGNAWIRPVLFGEETVNEAVTGKEYGYGSMITCTGWSNNTDSVSNRGMYITSTGIFGVDYCADMNPVACCK